MKKEESTSCGFWSQPRVFLRGRRRKKASHRESFSQYALSPLLNHSGSCCWLRSKFHKRHTSGNCFLWRRQDLGEHSDMVSYRHIPNVHREPINRVMYEPESGVVMTSSESDAASVIFMNVTLKRDPYIWGIKQVIYLTVLFNILLWTVHHVSALRMWQLFLCEL